MKKITIEDVFVAFKEYGSVKNAARALKIKGSKIYYLQRKPEWKALEEDFKNGKMKIDKKDPKELVDVRSNQFIEKRIGRAIEIAKAPGTKQLKLKEYKSKTAEESTKEDAGMTVKAAQPIKEEMTDKYSTGYADAVSKYEDGMKSLMDKIKEVEKEKNKIEIERNAARNANKVMNERLESMQKEIKEHRDNDNTDDVEELENENANLKSELGKYKTELREIKSELNSEKRLSERLSKRLKEIKEEQSEKIEIANTDSSTEFYKDTMHLYYEKFKQLNKA